MKWILSLLLAILAMLFMGCSAKVEYVDRVHEVKIPVQCQVPMPARPMLSKDVEGAKTLAIYSESLECALKLCRGETCAK